MPLFNKHRAGSVGQRQRNRKDSQKSLAVSTVDTGSTDMTAASFSNPYQSAESGGVSSKLLGDYRSSQGGRRTNRINSRLSIGRKDMSEKGALSYGQAQNKAARSQYNEPRMQSRRSASNYIFKRPNAIKGAYTSSAGMRNRTAKLG